GLVGAAVSEYPRLKELLREGIKLGGEVTLSSIRAEMLDLELAGLLKELGYKTLTIAPEAGSERLRSVINKCTDEAGILNVARLASDVGFMKLKLYFLAGLPTETTEDALEIVELTKRIRGEFKGNLTVSINPFIPKPVTPFEFHPFERIEILEERFSSIKMALRGLKGVKVNIFSPRQAFFQAALARGDRRLARVIAAAVDSGGSLKRAFKAHHKDNLPSADEYVYRERGVRELFPWDIIDHGVKKEILHEEYLRGLKGQKTAPCVVGACTRCGVC
ncbi:MAG: radical SAM protein, partial [Thermodesulfobacteriota bacterium]